jgi:hypothetical protein
VFQTHAWSSFSEHRLCSEYTPLGLSGTTRRSIHTHTHTHTHTHASATPALARFIVFAALGPSGHQIFSMALLFIGYHRFCPFQTAIFSCVFVKSASWNQKGHNLKRSKSSCVTDPGHCLTVLSPDYFRCVYVFRVSVRMCLCLQATSSFYE